MSQYKLVKLSSNEEVMFKVVDESLTHYIGGSPIVMHVVPQGQDQYGLQLFPYSPSAPESNVQINKAHIISECVNIPDGLEKAYIKRTTGIELASAFDAFTKL